MTPTTARACGGGWGSAASDRRRPARCPALAPAEVTVSTPDNFSDATYRRAFQRLNQLRQVGLFTQEPLEGYPGEIPTLLGKAFAVAEQHGLTLPMLAGELRLTLPRLRLLLGQPDSRPDLRLV